MSKKRGITLLVVCAVLSTCLAPASLATYESTDLEQEIIAPRYEFISFITATLSISSDGKADCYSATRAAPGYKVDLAAELQQQRGNSWTTVDEWESAGTNRVDVTGFKYVVPGYSYRLKVTVTIHDSSGGFVESQIKYSNVKEY